ncbi:hypothetical protein [Pedobacter cryotolerans]|uniref:Uncharacterized protein n=1 Tax=Pedobacter cryotolerans TaxID=2571270 RepID=A0A4U1C6V3_9SPHI|nr:hypothetical protein [Pedobacter cryotolerans]TKC01235.1 hypothetical protein FA045_08295 [Pedobacter cryotolerans]
MKEIKYHCKLFKEEIKYDLIETKSDAVYLLYHESTLIAQVKLLNNHCIQVGGRMISDKMLADIGNLLKNGTI